MLYPNDEGGYASYSNGPGQVSPAYVVAATAKRLIKVGQDVALPPEYNIDVLDRIIWRTGDYGHPVNVSVRQAEELAQIARTLQDDHGTEITPAEQTAIADLLKVVAARDAAD